MLASLGSWLAKLDPNVAVPIVLSALAFLYHTFLSPTAQAKVAAALNDAMELAQKAIDAAVALAPAGTTAAQLESDLLNIAKTQLQHAGLDPNKLPPVVLSLAQALVNVAVGKWRATQPAPQPQAVPIVSIPPIPPVPPAGAAKGAGRMSVVLALALGGSVGTIAALDVTGCGSTVGQVALKTGQCVLDSGVEAQVLTALATGNYAAAVAALTTTVPATLISCALQAIANGQGSGSGSGSASTAAGAPVDLAGRAKELLANPSEWQKK
jgi:hypothetical protein